MRILVLYWHPGPGEMRLAIHRHLHVLDRSETRHQIIYYNVHGGAPGWLGRLDLDAVILHSTMLCLRWSQVFYASKWKLRWICGLNCVKVAIPQDEYHHSEILDEWLFELGVTIIFSNFDETKRKLLYPIMHNRATFYTCFTGYIDDSDAQRCQAILRPARVRLLDVVYRGSHLPYWFGSHGQLKHLVAEVISRRAAAHGLTCDISTEVEDTIAGRKWLDFLASARTVIGCESGSSVLDRRGEVLAQINHYLGVDPDLSFHDVSKMMPKGWDDHAFVAIMPRHFEAVITKTCQVLVEGRYDEVLQPHKHYLPLKRDLSNVDEVMDQVRDQELVEAIAQRAYEDIYLSGRYNLQMFAQGIVSAISKEMACGRESGRGRRGLFDNVVWGLGTAAAPVSTREQRVRLKLGEWLVKVRSYRFVIRHPLVPLAKGYLALRFLLNSHTQRRILFRYLLYKELRRKVSFGQMVRDLLMLRLLHSVRAGQIPGLDHVRVNVCFEQTKGALMFRSSPTRGPSAIEVVEGVDERLWNAGEPIELRKIVWDHSSVGNQVLYPVFLSKRICFSLGPKGVYEYRALKVFARCFPEETWSCFIRFRASHASDFEE